MVVLHEHDVRRTKGDFGFLRSDPNLRATFLEKLSGLIQDAPMRLIASVIDKVALNEEYKNPWSPYEIALQFCLERLFEFLARNDQIGKEVHVIFESRGNEEYRTLELEFRRICEHKQNWGYRDVDFSKIAFHPRFSSEAANSTGLQLADLTARPIALKTLRPNQPNRAFEIIEPKLFQKKVFPDT